MKIWGGSPVAVWRALCNAECLQALIDHSPRIHRSCHRTMSHQVGDPLRYQKSIATRIIGQSNTHSGWISRTRVSASPKYASLPRLLIYAKCLARAGRNNVVVGSECISNLRKMLRFASHWKFVETETGVNFCCRRRKINKMKVLMIMSLTC